MESGALRASAVRVIERESAAVASLADQLDESFTSVIRILLGCRGKVLVAGSGTSHATALRFAHLLSCVGTPALFLHPGDSQHGASGAVAAEDVVIGLSKGGETTEVVFLAEIARLRGARVIAITEAPASSLGQAADVVLRATVPDDVDPFGMVATGSSLFFAALCDAVCVVLLEERGYSRDAFAETHPGGAVGQRIREGRG
jgi:D-arabinose 5-phosphate isomerase GutQ